MAMDLGGATKPIYSHEMVEMVDDWLVVSNMAGLFSISYMGYSSQLTFIFFKGVETTNQMKNRGNGGNVGLCTV